MVVYVDILIGAHARWMFPVGAHAQWTLPVCVSCATWSCVCMTCIEKCGEVKLVYNRYRGCFYLLDVVAAFSDSRPPSASGIQPVLMVAVVIHLPACLTPAL